MMITRNDYNAIVAEVEKMANLVMNNDIVSKIKYVKVGGRKFRVTFNWNATNFEGVVKVEEKNRSIYNTLFVWSSSETEKDFPEYFYEEVMERIKKEAYARFDFYVELAEGKTRRECAEMVYQEISEMTGFSVGEVKCNTALVEDSTEAYKERDLEVVEITKVEGLELGEPQHCHYNSAMYALNNDCNFVCGWYYSGGKFPIAHCIVEKDGKYIDPTLNKGGKFKVISTYTAKEICDIFDEVEQAFIPFIGTFKDDEYYVYNGTRRVSEEDFKKWEEYVYSVRY